jgi:predicted Zn-dependent protease
MTNKKSALIKQFTLLLVVSFLSIPFAHSKSLQSLELEHGCTPVPSTADASCSNTDNQQLTADPHGVVGGALVSATENKALSPQDYLADVAPDGLYCWPSNRLPVKVFFQVSDTVPFYRASFLTVLKSCFDEWSQASGGKLGWVEATDPESADIVAQWSAQPRERPEGTEGGRTKTYAQLNTSTNRGLIRKAEITLLTRLPNREFSDDEVRKAYLHEVGHAFGIAGHSPNRNDIMYFAVSKQRAPHLADRDRATINHLYREYEPLRTVVGSGPISKHNHS